MIVCEVLKPSQFDTPFLFTRSEFIDRYLPIKRTQSSFVVFFDGGIPAPQRFQKD